MKFRTTIVTAGKTATGIEVPAEIVEKLGAGKKPPVCITIKGHTYRSSIASMGGKFMVGVSAENRGKAGVAGGDEVEVTIELDKDPREVTLPPDLSKALKENPEAKQLFYKLAYSHKLRHVLAIEQAKTPETRQRRVDGAITIILGKNK